MCTDELCVAVGPRRFSSTSEEFAKADGILDSADCVGLVLLKAMKDAYRQCNPGWDGYLRWPSRLS